MKINYAPLSGTEGEIASKIVDSAFRVHSRLGPGLLESAYEECFCHEIRRRGLRLRRQVPVPIFYDDIQIQVAFRIDVIVEELIICELKAVDSVIPLHQTQLLTYMKLYKKRLGFLINFNVPMIRNGIKRMIL